MPLEKGIYEQLITGELQEQMQESAEQGLVCIRQDIDEAESAAMLADYISNLVYRRLESDKLPFDERKQIANKIISQLFDTTDADNMKDSSDNPKAGSKTKQAGQAEPTPEQAKAQALIADSQMLAEVMTEAEQAMQQKSRQQTLRPLSGFRVSNLFTGGGSQLSIGNEIERDIASADSISLIVSFLKLSGVNLIYDALRRFCDVDGHRLRIITTTYCGITEAKAVARLAELPNTEIRISYQTNIERLHAKAYIFERRSGMDTAYIGSSNLSRSAQTDGLEWNIRVTNVENPHIIKSALATFERYWNSPNFEDFRLGGIERFNEKMREAKEQIATMRSVVSPNPIIIPTTYNILPHQKQILDKLTLERAAGHRRNLVVAATGTGKTVISAFDFRSFAQGYSRAGKPSPRILFVAHREEILRQALQTYRNVLADQNFGELWVGDHRPQRFERLFISVQTFNSRFDELFAKLPANYYDYIVVDEAHHSAADSYRNIFSHFTPQLLVGLTATPERMDGLSLLPDFDGKISAEIRLPRALDEGLLTPFQYFCISDTATDLRSDDLLQGGRYITSRILNRLCTQARVELILRSLDCYIADTSGCRALCFCADREHARFMAEALRRAGLRAASLTTDNQEERLRLNKQLRDADINFLCVVDMFNEGVDIPEVDTVLFLRPTESLTIFLQQLGRGLRLAPGKQVLTVLDYVAQLNNKYDYASRFRALLTRTDRSLRDQLTNGFTLLPHGCSIHLEEQAQRIVLENISAAIYNQRRLIGTLQGFAGEPTLAEFVDHIGQDIRLIYKGNRCWTSLRRDAGKCAYASDVNTDSFTQGLGTLTHVNSVAYLRFIEQLAYELLTSPDAAATRSAVDSLAAREPAFALMLYYALFRQRIDRLGADSIEAALMRLASYPLFADELRQLARYLLDHLEQLTTPIAEGLPDELAAGLPPRLEQYGCYTREEVFILFGRQTPTKVMQGSVTGVFNIDELNLELLFVTLNKSDADFSPSTQYDDYVISPERFHWQSQNSDSHAGRGQRYVDQRQNGKRFILFVREAKRDGFGNTMPFYCFGLVDYVSSHGDRPMNIEWQLRKPVMPQFVTAV